MPAENDRPWLRFKITSPPFPEATCSCDVPRRFLPRAVLVFDLFVCLLLALLSENTKGLRVSPRGEPLSLRSMLSPELFWTVSPFFSRKRFWGASCVYLGVLWDAEPKTLEKKVPNTIGTSSGLSISLFLSLARSRIRCTKILCE